MSHADSDEITQNFRYSVIVLNKFEKATLLKVIESALKSVPSPTEEERNQLTAIEGYLRRVSTTEAIDMPEPPF